MLSQYVFELAKSKYEHENNLHNRLQTSVLLIAIGL